jgi:muramoyltetrapeptide carboxypeptidase
MGLCKKPFALKAGDNVRLVAPASPFDFSLFQQGVQIIGAMGFVPVWGEEETSSDGYFAGSDRSRAARFENALKEKKSKAVWCIRGGYGSARILEFLDKSILSDSGKLIVGFSDLTALLLNASFPRGTVSIHGPVVTQLPRQPQRALDHLKNLLCSKEAIGRIPLGSMKRLTGGRAKGYLVGGNLSILASLVGTPWLPSLDGAILFLEDVGEQAYRLDRAFSQLKQSGALAKLKAFILGSLAGCEPDADQAGSARSVLEREIMSFGVPAVSGASFGHMERNVAIPMGAKAILDADQRTLTLTEPLLS